MNINLEYPRSWEEVSEKHLRILGSLFLKERTREDLLFELFCKFTGIRLLMREGMDEGTPAAVYFFKKKGQKFSLPVAVIRDACEEMAFLIETVGLPESPIPSVNKKLHGISFKQYYFADAYCMQYDKTKKVQYINSMYEVLTGVKPSSLLKDDIMAINIWWVGVKKYMKDQYPEVFSEGEESALDKTPADTLVDILSILNENKPERNGELLEADVHAVLHALNNIYSNSKQHAVI